MKRPGDLATAPQSPGVYMFHRGEEVLYVGKAKNLKRRLSQYFSGALSSRIERMVEEATKLSWVVCTSETEALSLERDWIAAHQPPFNIMLKNGSGYAGIAITRETVPRVFAWRGAAPAKAKSYGPYPGISSRELIRALTLAFGVRSCNTSTYQKASKEQRACILADTGHCLAPCIGAVSIEQHAQGARNLESYLAGNQTRLLDSLKARMAEHAENLQYEQAALDRDRIRALEGTLERQVAEEVGTWSGVAIAEFHGARVGVAAVTLRQGRVISVQTASTAASEELEATDVLREFAERLEIDETSVRVAAGAVSGFRAPRGSREAAALDFAAKQARNAALYGGGADHYPDAQQAQAELERLLGLSRAPERIEAVDVSHTGGREPVAAFAVVENGELVRDQVRYVNVPSGGDDIAAIAHAVSARLNGRHLGLARLPDVLLIDGGPAQTNAAAQLMRANSDIAVFGIAKRLEELWAPDAREPIILPRSSGLGLLMFCRDQAHSLALRRHTAKRDRALTRTKLDEVRGVGPKRARQLQSAFGSHEAILAATRRQFQEVLGKTIGARAWDDLHDQERNKTETGSEN